MEKIRVAIVFGGNSSEYGVSLHSVASVLTNIDRERYDVCLFGITRQGDMYHYLGDIEAIEADTWMQKEVKKATLSLNPSDRGFIVWDQAGVHVEQVDVVFPVMHGKFGEDGTLQGALALSQLPFVGCDTLSSSVSMDKQFTHILCEAAGIAMAPYQCVIQQPDLDFEQCYQDAVAALGLPIFIKPANAGSSYGISKIRDYEGFVAGMEAAFQHDPKVLLETTISGFEVGCAVLGNDTLIVGEVDEIETHRDFFDFEGKYEMSDSKIHCPARISSEIKAEVQRRAQIVYRALGCSGFSRVDFFLDDEQNIVFNELNTIPGFTAHSRYPSMMKAIGIDFTSLIDRLIQLALLG
ncbi:MAG: D-alanine--D-alanine ligase family protein [Erysipelotrichaceae bacterium]